MLECLFREGGFDDSVAVTAHGNIPPAMAGLPHRSASQIALTVRGNPRITKSSVGISLRNNPRMRNTLSFNKTIITTREERGNDNTRHTEIS